MIKIQFASDRLRDLYTANAILEIGRRYTDDDLYGWLAPLSRLPANASLSLESRPVADFNWWAHAVVVADRPQRLGAWGHAANVALETAGATLGDGAWGHATLQRPLANGIMETVNRWGLP